MEKHLPPTFHLPKRLFSISSIHLFISILSLAATTTTAYSGAWVQNAEEGLSISKVNFYYSDHYWDQDNQHKSASTYKKLEVNPYLEYGVTELLTCSVNMFLPYIDSEAQGSNFGLGDLELAGRYLLWKDGDSVFSGQLLLKIPGLYDVNTTPSLGLGQEDLELRLLYGHAWQKSSGQTFYLDVESAYRMRFAGVSDEIIFDWTLGWKSPDTKWNAELKMQNSFSMHNNKDISSDSYGGQSIDYDLHTVTLAVLYWMTPRAGVEMGMSEDCYGKNIGDGTTIYTALWLKF